MREMDSPSLDDALIDPLLIPPPQDSENNTILIILAGLGSNSVSSPYRSPQDDPDLQDTAMRMARQYWERFPFITDWSNLQGRTALHVAALKGSEDFVRVCSTWCPLRDVLTRSRDFR